MLNLSSQGEPDTSSALSISQLAEERLLDAQIQEGQLIDALDPDAAVLDRRESVVTPGGQRERDHRGMGTARTAAHT